MDITGWALFAGTGSKPRFPGETLLTIGDKMTAVQLIRKGQREKDLISDTLMRSLGCMKYAAGDAFARSA